MAGPEQLHVRTHEERRARDGGVAAARVAMRLLRLRRMEGRSAVFRVPTTPSDFI